MEHSSVVICDAITVNLDQDFSGSAIGNNAPAVDSHTVIWRLALLPSETVPSVVTCSIHVMMPSGIPIESLNARLAHLVK